MADYTINDSQIGIDGKRIYYSSFNSILNRLKISLFLKIGDILLIHEANTPPQTWCKGHITATMLWNDEIVKVVHPQYLNTCLSEFPP